MPMNLRDDTIINRAIEILRRRLQRHADPEDYQFDSEEDRVAWLEWGNQSLSFMEYATSTVPPSQIIDHIKRTGSVPAPRQGFIGK